MSDSILQTGVGDGVFNIIILVIVLLIIVIFIVKNVMDMAQKMEVSPS
mgnify:CR=1